jgi:putative ABC transport system permease protein
VTREPERFGAPWDAWLSNATPADAEPEALAGVDGVEHAALLGGSDIAIGNQPSVWVQAFFPVDGVPVSEPLIVEGRPPVADDEIVLGRLTLDAAGAEVGDRIEVRATGPGEPLEFEIVGVAMVTDGAEPNVGQGAIVTPAGMNEVEPGSRALGNLAMKVTDGPDREETLGELRDLFPSLVEPFPIPTTLLNAERVSGLPLLLALGAATLAGATFAHALVVSIRRGRRELAVCRVLGFTPGQVRLAIATQATVLALGSVAVGVPLGVIGARWGWRVVAEAFGLVTEPRVPVAVAVLCAAAVVVVANLSAASTWAATRRRTAEILRTE